MKKTYLLAVNPLHFLTILPLAAIFAVSVIYIDISTSYVGLYPLAIVSGVGILVTLLYFSRIITISFDEVRYFRVFGGKEYSYIKKDSRIELKEVGALSRINVYCTENTPAIEWLREDTAEPQEIPLLKKDFFSFPRGAAKVLKYFGVPRKDIDSFMSGGELAFENDDISVFGCTSDGKRRAEIFFKTTL